MKLRLLTLAIVGILLPAVVNADSIGVHFPSDRDNAMLLPTDVAGLPGLAQGNWNTSDGGVDAGANASGSTSGLVDDSGVATTAGVEWTSNGTWNTVNGTATPDAKLMNGYIDAIGADNPFSTVVVRDIPYPQYDAIVYFGSDGNGRTGQVTDGTTTYGYSTFSNDPDGSGGFDPSDYLITTDNSGGNPEANFAVFGGLTDPTLQIDIIRGSSNSGIHGVQIIGVPEPSTIVFLSMTGLVFVCLRRRR